MPDWEPIDPQLRQWAAEGINPMEMCRRLGWDRKKRQTMVDHLRKLGLYTPGQSKPTTLQEEPMTDEVPVEVLPGQMSITDADTPPDDAVSAIADITAVSEISEPLSPAEVQTLAHYEQIIDQGIKTFVEVGNALLTIRAHHLYRQDYATFEDYCRERWNLSRPYAYQLMDASEVVTNLSAIADILPVTETQARPLASLPPEQQQAVWQEAVKTAPAGKVTAKHVKETVKRVKQGTTTPKVAKPKMPQPEATPPRRQRVQDGLFAVLSLVDDQGAWKILGELALQMSTYAEDHAAPDLQQRIEQALSPLWHLIEDHQQTATETTFPCDFCGVPIPADDMATCDDCGQVFHELCLASHEDQAHATE